ncbi:MAG: hypothetical protein Q8O24_07660 [Gallionellaceae bacterium]|nr:hypothetical protein [Gallionellaceae bacterium]
MKVLNLKKCIQATFAVGISFATLTTCAYAGDRVIEDSLVYNDPTLSKQDDWIKGGSIDYHNVYNVPSSVTDTAGAKYTATNSYGMTGLSGFVGKGNLTFLVSFRQGSGNMSVPYGGTTYSWTKDMSEVEVDARYLLTQFSSTYFVPYTLAGYTSGTETWSYAYDYSPGVKQKNTYSITGPLVGLGGIVPISDKMGLRVDVKQAWLSNSVSSNIAAFDGKTLTATTTRLTLTGYYNIDTNLNVQLGLRNDSNSYTGDTTAGMYAMLGYTFK